MIKFKKLIIDNYRLYENAELDFTQLNGLITLLGNNKDIENFSSNSVGKSTMIDAILTVLFGKNLNNTSLENNINLYSGKKPSVTMEVEINDVNYIVINDYNINLLEVYINGEPVDTTKKKDTFAYIEKMLGLNHFLMKHLIYLSPNSSSIFSESDTTLQSKFVQQLLNLDFISEFNKKVSNDLKIIKGEVQVKIKELDIYQTQVETLNKQLALIPEVVQIDYQPDINRLSGDKVRAEDFVKTKQKIKESLTKEFDKLKNRATELKTEIRLLEQTIKKKVDLSKAGICPTCGSDTHGVECNSEKDNLTQLNQELEECNKLGLAKRSEMLDADAEVTLAKSNLEDVGKELDEVKRKRDIALGNEAQRGARVILEAQLTDALKALIKVQAELTELEDDKYCLELLTQCSSAKGFIKERIDLFLHIYNIELKSLAKSLLGEGHSVKIIRDDTNKYFLEVEDGDITLNYNMLSSGFKSRLDVLLILALNKTVETLTGVSVNILILDEVLSAVDVQGVEAMQELLIKIQHMFPEKLVFVVSHNQTLRFDSTLTIYRENNRSRFIINNEE